MHDYCSFQNVVQRYSFKSQIAENSKKNDSSSARKHETLIRSVMKDEIKHLRGEVQLEENEKARTKDEKTRKEHEEGNSF